MSIPRLDSFRLAAYTCGSAGCFLFDFPIARTYFLAPHFQHKLLCVPRFLGVVSRLPPAFLSEYLTQARMALLQTKSFFLKSSKLRAPPVGQLVFLDPLLG